jgi:hypothetical protein
MVKSIINDISGYLARSEETTMRKFMRITGKNDQWSFADAGYKIARQRLKDGIDGTMLWRITLLRYDQEVIHQDIEVKFNITME